MNKVSASGALALCFALSACNTSNDGFIGAVGDMPGTCLKQARAQFASADPELLTGASPAAGGFQVQGQLKGSPVSFTCHFDRNALFVRVTSGFG